MNLAIAWIQVHEDEDLRVTERQLIKYHQPVLNERLKQKDAETHIKINLGHRREIIERIAENDNRSISKAICLLLDIVLDRYDEISESGKRENRKFIKDRLKTPCL